MVAGAERKFIFGCYEGGCLGGELVLFWWAIVFRLPQQLYKIRDNLEISSNLGHTHVYMADPFFKALLRNVCLKGRQG